MRKIGILVILAVFFAGFGFSVARMERLRADGADALLQLAPVDPRALLMGDYMALDYAANDAIWDALRRKEGDSRHPGSYYEPGASAEGKAVMKRAAPGDGRGGPGAAAPFPAVVFVRLDDGTPLAQDELLLAFKLRGMRIITAAPAFYFQEGDARVYERARYGRVKVDGNGKTLLFALCDDAGRDLRPARGE
ncbi:conserved exported hypothetical protein [uncultured delta proteobacterium]|uniref:GDYXXLXY family protein n=1 Tax=uncultured delta proteobacterium TaxID=34034 RepID=A0A212KCK5_9DELT|nr:conserved exported hypothetical protein [uncultured delta proteobacterium]